MNESPTLQFIRRFLAEFPQDGSVLSVDRVRAFDVSLSPVPILTAFAMEDAKFLIRVEHDAFPLGIVGWRLSEMAIEAGAGQ